MDFLPSLQNQSQEFSQLAETKMDRLQKQALSGEYKEEKELKALAQQFEGIFMNQLMKAMRATLPKEGMLSSFSVDMYESMFDQEVAGEMSKGKGMGLADVLYMQLSRMNGTPPESEEGSATDNTAAAPLQYYVPGKKENP